MKNFQTLRVAVLCSKRAPGLDALLHHPHRGGLFEIACVVTTENDFADARKIEAHGVPVLYHPIHRFFDANRKPLCDMATRREYDTFTARVLKQINIDTVVLLGYLYVLTERMLSAFPERIINVHDSDLTLTNEKRDRKYVGLHSTRDAVTNGERETRSTVHLVTEDLDEGPVLLLSRTYPVAPFAVDAAMAGHADIVKAYSYAHREWMMRRAWGPMVVAELEKLACGAVAV